MALKKLQKAIHQVFNVLKAKQVLLPTGIERQFLLDDQNGHYQLQNIGWQNSRYTHSTLVHVDIKNDFVWVQVDNPSASISEIALEVGFQSLSTFNANFKRFIGTSPLEYRRARSGTELRAA